MMRNGLSKEPTNCSYAMFSRNIMLATWKSHLSRGRGLKCKSQGS